MKKAKTNCVKKVLLTEEAMLKQCPSIKIRKDKKSYDRDWET